MKNREVALRNDKDPGCEWLINDHTGVTICMHGLRKYVEISPVTPRAYLVASTKSNGLNCFKLGGRGHAGIIGVRGDSVQFGLRTWLAEAMADGYKYVWIEV